jgi:cellulose synthase/poly-beta-1,6-N-acetylglucosamine synthase-like glycosyltransferase
MIVAAQIVFWMCLAVCVYVYFGYPALLAVLSALRPRAVREAEIFPRATFIIPAYNEERNIAAKIENSLAVDYPAEAIEVLVVSNGSTDATNTIVAQWRDKRVRLIALPEPGKMPALNEGARAATGEILVFTDADFFLDAHSLKEIARKFADPEVGGVCGARGPGMKREGDATGDGEGLYGRWDKWQKVRESRIGSVFAADGLLYAIRKSLYVPVADADQADDIAISSQVVLQGYRLLFEPNATAWEKSVVNAEQEFGRKIRVTNHSVRALLNLGSALFTRGFYSVELLSHKLVRHFVPLFMIPLLAASILLGRVNAFYAFALIGQAAMYGLATLGALLRNSALGHAKPFAVPYYFCFVNAAALFGILSIFRGRRTRAWSSRATPSASASTRSSPANLR